MSTENVPMGEKVILTAIEEQELRETLLRWLNERPDVKRVEFDVERNSETGALDVRILNLGRRETVWTRPDGTRVKITFENL